MLTWLGYIDGIHGAPYIAAPWILWDMNYNYSFAFLFLELEQICRTCSWCWGTAGVSASQGQMRLKVWVRMTWKLGCWMFAGWWQELAESRRLLYIYIHVIYVFIICTYIIHVYIYSSQKIYITQKTILQVGKYYGWPKGILSDTRGLNWVIEWMANVEQTPGCILICAGIACFSLGAFFVLLLVCWKMWHIKIQVDGLSTTMGSLFDQFRQPES
jgi:hypothetical protein